MKVIELLEKRRQYWQELEKMCDDLDRSGQLSVGPLAIFRPVKSLFRFLASLLLRTAREGSKPPLGPAAMLRFSSLYRAACADLALADAYQLPTNTVQYLHRLVGRAHNQLYRSRKFNLDTWAKLLLEDVPRTIFHDRCVQLMFAVFWGIFVLAAFLAYHKESWPNFTEAMIGEKMAEKLEHDFEQAPGRSPEDNVAMAAFYIQHNTGIGLQCFAWGLLVIPGLFVSVFNSATLGAIFGVMARPDMRSSGENFFNFVTAHGPFELTAIVLSAGAGLRLGVSWISTRGFSRAASLQQTAQQTMPLMGAAMIMFFMAAMIEGFLSPTAAPYWIKASVAVLSSGLLMFYFVILGFPRSTRIA